MNRSASLARCSVLVALAVAGPSLAAFAQEASKTEEATKKKKARKPVATDLSGFELLPPEQLAEKTTIVAATRGLKPRPPLPLAPYVGRAHSTRPMLMWTTRAAEVVLVVQDAAGAELLNERVAAQSRSYGGPELQPGATYTWTVSATPGGTSEPSSLQVVGGAEREAVDAALAAADATTFEGRLERARVLAEHGLWYDCISAYTELIDAQPDRAELYEERGAVLSQALRARERADEDAAAAERLRSPETP